MSLTQKAKAEVIALDTLAGVRGETARLYRLVLNGRVRSEGLRRKAGKQRLPSREYSVLMRLVEQGRSRCATGAAG